MKVVRVISAFPLAFLVLASSSSFSIGVHLCYGRVIDVALFTNAKKCETEQLSQRCNKRAMSPCCEDQTVTHNGEGFHEAFVHLYLSSPTVLDIEKPSGFSFRVIQPILIVQSKCNSYKPPLRSVDRVIIQRTFLI